LGGSFADFYQLRSWLFSHEDDFAHADFWKSEDVHLLWEGMRGVEHAPRPVKWERLAFTVDAMWYGRPPTANERLRLISQEGNRVMVTSLSLLPLGEASLPVDGEGVLLDAVGSGDGRIDVEYFGPV
jgi:hypothetical protein